MSINVLLVDDHDLSLVSMRNFLVSIGFTVQAFSCPLEALESSRQNNYDLIVSDLRLPHMNGIELISSVREIQPQIKAILITGYYTDKAEKEAHQAGIEYVFAKPIQITEFIRTVNDILPDRMDKSFI